MKFLSRTWALSLKCEPMILWQSVQWQRIWMLLELLYAWRLVGHAFFTGSPTMVTLMLPQRKLPVAADMLADVVWWRGGEG